MVFWHYMKILIWFSFDARKCVLRYWVTQKWPKICTVILHICIGKIAWFSVYICGNLWTIQYLFPSIVVSIVPFIRFICSSKPGTKVGLKGATTSWTYSTIKHCNVYLHNNQAMYKNKFKQKATIILFCLTQKVWLSSLI